MYLCGKSLAKQGNMSVVFTVIYYILLLVYVYFIAKAVIDVLLDDRSPIRQIAWIVALIFLPFVGLIFYYFFGRNYRRNQSFRCKQTYKDLACTDVDTDVELEKLKSSNTPYYFHQSVQMMVNISTAEIYQNSKFDILTSGAESFERLFEDIENAKEYIHIEFFIIEDDKIGNELRRLLIRKSQERVKVRVIYDYLGSYRLSESYRQSLKNEGVMIYPLMPFGFKIGYSKINYRNHRKIVIIDGKVGYTGGLNVADRYVYGNRLGEWRDTLVRIEGEAVHGLQKTFLADWYFVENKLITGEKYYPDAKIFSNNQAQVISSGPDTDWESILLGLITFFFFFLKNIYIHTPYFLPPESLLITLQMAAMSGIDVRIMIPQKSDTLIVAAASASYYKKLMEAGVKVYLYQNNFLHSKAITIDDEVGIVGTANMDIRSYEHHYEVNAFIYDKQTAITLRKAFEDDMDKCILLNLEDWLKRPLYIRLKESIARLFSPLL